jgi:hypothetical protein
MKFVLLIVYAILFLTGLYYATWTIHVMTPIFGRWIDPVKALIPFYGWINWFKKPNYK